MLFDNMFEEKCLINGAPNYVSYFTAILSILFIMTNIPGNLLVILAVAIDPHKNLRVPFNYLMTNLAVADLLVGTVTGCIAINYHLKDGLDKQLSLNQIHTFDMSYFISCTASVLSLTALAIERYHAACNPHAYRKNFSGKRVVLTIAIIWSVSLSLPFSYFKVGFIGYSFIFANTSIILAVGITCFTYTIMLYKFKRHARNIRESTVPSTSTFTSTSNLNLQVTHAPPTRGAHHSNAVAWEHKITKMYLVVMIALLCCYGPSTVFIYAMSFCENCSCKTLHWFRDLEFLFVILNSSVNFFCYALRSPRFRHAFAHMLRIKSRDRCHARTFVTSNAVFVRPHPDTPKTERHHDGGLSTNSNVIRATMY